jgi:tRNA-uridine 2-sulfurtransferase
MRVLVAMSGGVDSSVVAGLMREAGHEVIGATLQLYDHGAARRDDHGAARRDDHGAATRSGKSCCAGQDIHDARNVADVLGIPHYVLDREQRFRTAVIEDFADTYARGETPIPCIRCNQTVKFQDLIELARDLGCEALATGHYARRVDGADGPELHRAADPARDQSYFLAMTTRAQLAFARFPLGDMTDKETVRGHAERLGLPVARKPDSQDICFVPSGDHAATIATLRPETAEAGEIVNQGGRVLGTHAGIGRFTVGQARGLGIGGGDRLFVQAVDAPRRRIVVGPREALPRAEAIAGEVNWLIPPPAAPIRVQAKLRARETPRPAMAAWDAAAGVMRLTLEEPNVVAPGQAAVLYDGDRVLGGGFLRASPIVDMAAPTAYSAPPDPVRRRSSAG